MFLPKNLIVGQFTINIKTNSTLLKQLNEDCHTCVVTDGDHKFMGSILLSHSVTYFKVWITIHYLEIVYGIPVKLVYWVLFYWNFCIGLAKTFSTGRSDQNLMGGGWPYNRSMNIWYSVAYCIGCNKYNGVKLARSQKIKSI